ncbi:MAG: hypothetical protein CSA55_00495 [Ilumatobacter coccineus]|uniref:Uncharacterized protein n=1 Tax=Ilumatobacter coccineus TaxID=467094 RepID=A0A2G6KG14_9ACTN|nr:MAG: hypothetical protein CSA55_00495 [Ilumatobacter coccineus]
MISMSGDLGQALDELTAIRSTDPLATDAVRTVRLAAYTMRWWTDATVTSGNNNHGRVAVTPVTRHTRFPSRQLDPKNLTVW